MTGLKNNNNFNEDKRCDDENYYNRNNNSNYYNDSNSSLGIYSPTNSRNSDIITFKIGDLIDVFDSSGYWCEAEILKIDETKQSIYVSYLYWNSQFDEWINNLEQNTAPLNTHTYYEGGPYKVGQRVEALDERNTWLHAYIIDQNDTRVKVHYHGFHSKFDAWLNKSVDNIRRYGRSHASSKKYSKAKKWRVPVSIPQDEYKSNDDAVIDKSSVVPSNQTERQRQINQFSDQYNRYISKLSSEGLSVVQMQGDGNCLFRSVAHQIYGNDELHWMVRQRCMDYMEANSEFFSQFIEGGIECFHFYLQAKRLNACWGDDPEIQAICELYDRSADIWAYDRENGARKLRTFHEASSRRGNQAPMRLSYYGGGHYDSIIDSNFSNNIIRQRPGEIEDIALSRVRLRQSFINDQANSNNAANTSDTNIIDRSIYESRHDYHWAQDDLDSCLALSFHDDNIASTLVVPDIIHTKAELPAPIRDVIATQSEILSQVQENSEREYLDQAILSSLEGDNDTIITEESLLKQALEQSLCTDGSAPDNMIIDDNTTENMNLKLSTLTEEELLELAIKQSMEQNNTLPMQSNEKFSDYITLDNQDDMLNAAIKASINESYNRSVPIYYDSNSNWVSNAFDDDEEDINKAILESLRK